MADAPAPAPSSHAAIEVAPRRFLRAFGRALGDEGTYDVRRNPSIWLGFVMALPIPFLSLTATTPLWLDWLSLFAPLFWAVVLGAAGRVGILAEEERERLALEYERAQQAQESLEEALDEEVERRMELQVRQEEVISELKLAQAVQRTLLPEDIEHPQLTCAVKHLPSLYVGGDYINTVVVDDRWAYLCLADVAGHGVAAALVVARIHGLVRRVTLQKRKPDAILERLNRAALTVFRHTYFFMTFAVFRIDLRTGHMDYATAGHPGQVLLRRDGSIEVLRTPNRLLGMDADIFDSRRPTDATQLQPGDRIVMFTDGLFEIMGAEDGEMLGEERLHERIVELRDLEIQLMAGELISDAADYQGAKDFDDDVTLIVAEYHGTPGPAPDRIAGP